MKKVKLGAVSQTPLVRFFKHYKKETVRLSQLDERKYVYTIGGVAPLIKAQIDS